MVPGFFGFLLFFFLSFSFKVQPGLRLISPGPTTKREDRSGGEEDDSEAAGLRASLGEERGLLGDSSMGGQWRSAGLVFEAGGEGSGKNEAPRTATRSTDNAYLTSGPRTPEECPQVPSSESSISLSKKVRGTVREDAEDREREGLGTRRVGNKVK